MHSADEAAQIAAAFVATPFSGEPRHQRRIDILDEYQRTGEPPHAAARPDPLMPEGHTLHRLARLHRRRFAGDPVAVSSPQGRFATSAEVVDGRVLERAEAYGKHLFHHYGPDLVVHVHLGLYGTFSDLPLPAAAPRGLVRMRMVGADPLRRPARADGVRADHRRRGGAIRARLGADPLRPDADPDRAWARISRVPGAAGHAADGPEGDRRRRQRLPGRGAVPARARPAACRAARCAGSSGTRCGPTWWAAARRGAPRQDRDGARRSTIRGCRAGPPGATCARRGLRLPAHREPCLVCGTPMAHDAPGAQPVLVPDLPAGRRQAVRSP